MTTTETRYTLLTRLAWELRATGTTTHLTLPACGEPILWVIGGTERRDPVVATQYQNRWLLLWRGLDLEAGRSADVARSVVTALRAEPAGGHLRDAAQVIAAAVTA